MSSLQCFIIFLGRVCIALTFIFIAFHNISEWNSIVKMIESKGIPQPQIFFAVTKALYALGGLMLLCGWHTRIASFMLMVVLGVNSYLFHDFWNMDDPEMMHTHMKLFAMILANFGGLLYVLACGAGCCCCDDTTCKVEESER